jgi:malonate-semialdehyde dehydrogenase (acetylating)/methylmalonate-semialdehyde dehydrogenase
MPKTAQDACLDGLEADSSLRIESPIDYAEVGQVRLTSADALDRCVAAAATAQKSWGATPVKQRAEVMYRLKQVLQARLTELAELIHRENGKTIGEARAEVERGIEVVEFAAGMPQMGLETRLEVSRGVDCESRRCPLGVVAGITPFNFPAMVPMWMFPLALAAGNGFVLKPSEQVPLSARLLGEMLAEAGLPDDVFQVVYGGRALSEALLDHPAIAAVGFVGSSAAAASVYQRGAAQGKRVLALGGAKNHLVLMPDADVEIAAGNIVSSAMGCAGQRCMAASVLLAVGDCGDILQRVTEIAADLKPGKDLGPLISAKARDRVVGHIDRAERDGARLILDGRKDLPDAGYYVGPTIIDRLPAHHDTFCEEIFGPVLAIQPVATLDDAIAIENADPHGNAAAIYTSAGAAARHFAQHASAGMVGINIGVPVPRDPFGFGGWNRSRFGHGDMTGTEGVLFWTRARKITQKWNVLTDRNWMS